MNNIKIVKNSQKGVALILALGMISILASIVTLFIYESTINRRKISNSAGNFKVRLAAEAGVNFAMAKLRIYQKGFNLIQKNKNISKMVKPDMLNEFLTQPFVWPIPIYEDDNLTKKMAIDKFKKDMLIDSNLSVTIQPLTGILNPNLLILSKDSLDNYQDQYSKKGTDLSEITKQEFIKTLTTAIEQKTNSDEKFALQHGNIDPEFLVEELQYYVSKEEYTQNLQYLSEISTLYERTSQAKHAPINSKSELYMLEGWGDDIVNLIINRIIIADITYLNINELNKDQIQTLFPEAQEEMINDLLLYRNGDPSSENEEDQTPKPFKSVKEFQTMITEKFMVATKEQFDDLLERLKKLGISLELSSELYLISSLATNDETSSKIEAIVSIPLVPRFVPPEEKEDKFARSSKKETSKTEIEFPDELRTPRIISIRQK